MDGMTGTAPTGGRAMVKLKAQKLWRKGEMLERLNALGWSRRAFAEAVGESEQLLRHYDDGKPLHQQGAIEHRERVYGWIEGEEALRRKNPLPVRPGVEPVGAGGKHRKVSRAKRPSQEVVPRRGRKAGAAEGASPDSEVPEVVAETSPRSEGPEIPEGASLADRMAAAAQGEWVRLVMPEVPDIAPPVSVEGRMTPEQVRQVYDYGGLGPREIARRAGVPQLERDVRRMARRAGGVKPDAKAWLEGIAAAQLSDPVVAAWRRRVYAFHAWRGEIERRVNEAWLRIDAEAPPERRVAEWDEAVDRAARDLPYWMRPKPKDGEVGAPPAGDGSGPVVVEDRRGRGGRVVDLTEEE